MDLPVYALLGTVSDDVRRMQMWAAILRFQRALQTHFFLDFSDGCVFSRFFCTDATNRSAASRLEK
jgi:hypothetical protein